MDATDERILEALKQNGRATASQIGRLVNLSVPAAAERIRRLAKSGIIEGYTVRLNRALLGYRLLAMVFVGIAATQDIESFRKSAVQCAEILECHHTAGEYDYLLKVLVEDTDALERFLSKKLKAMPGVVRTNTVVVLSTIKQTLNR
jgi:Lrp/AsnC family leucine-responsive transcriptional regulator